MEFENLCFVSLAQMVWVSCALLQCGRRKQSCDNFFSKIAFIHIHAIDYIAKTTVYMYFICQSLVNEHFKPNPNSVECRVI